MEGIVGILWYNELDYPKLFSVFEDAKLPDSFDEWINDAKDNEEHFRQRGFEVFRIEFVSEKFIAWCKREQLRPNAYARKRYAAIMAARAVENPKQ